MCKTRYTHEIMRIARFFIPLNGMFCRHNLY